MRSDDRYGSEGNCQFEEDHLEKLLCEMRAHKKRPEKTTMDKKEIIRNRLKSVLFGLREKYPALAYGIDKIVPFIVFKQTLTDRQLAELFDDYPSRTPADYHAITIQYIQQTVQSYHCYILTDKGLRAVNRDMRQLEQILQMGFTAYRLKYDEVYGYDLELK